MESKTPKAHRTRSAGPKADKKSPHKNAQKNNPRVSQDQDLIISQAFAFNSGSRANKTIQRNLDKDQKKLHVPLVDRTPVEAPPVVIAVVGPPGVIIFTFIKPNLHSDSLVKQRSSDPWSKDTQSIISMRSKVPLPLSLV